MVGSIGHKDLVPGQSLDLLVAEFPGLPCRLSPMVPACRIGKSSFGLLGNRDCLEAQRECNADQCHVEAVHGLTFDKRVRLRGLFRPAILSP